MKKSIEILDTTLRDGEQTQGIAFASSEKLSLAKFLLQKLNVPRIEIASARVSEGEKEAVCAILSWAKTENLLHKVEVLGFLDSYQSINWLLDAGGKVLNLLAKGSEQHCKTQLRKTLQEHSQDIQDNTMHAVEKGIDVNLYLEACSSGFIENRSYLFDLIASLQHLPIKRYMLPDTLGIFSPDEVSEFMDTIVGRFPDLHFDFHAHNDYGVATANSFIAAKHGAKAIHCTLNGLGERTGNASLFEVAVLLTDKLHLQTNIDESCFMQASRMVQGFTNQRIPHSMPIVGKNVFTQTSGIHADGDKKGSLYQYLKPQRFGRSTSYALGKMSGKASLQQNLNALGITLNEEEKQATLKKIISLGDDKTAITKEDLRFIIADILGSTQYQRLQMKHYAIHSSSNLKSTASLHLSIDQQEYYVTGSGNGGFDAFMDAMLTAMQPYNFELPKLIDYEVLIPHGGTTNALTICSIHWEKNEVEFETTGLHSNQVFSAIEAAIKMFNLCLDKEDLQCTTSAK